MPDKFIPLSVPNLNGKEKEYVFDAIETQWVSTAGKYVVDFEKKIEEYVKSDMAASCQSGTAGLHLALIVTGVGANDMVIVPTLTFIAAVNPVRYANATPVFMDCDDSLCIDPVKLEEFCKNECEIKGDNLYHKQSGKRVPAIIVVHVFGNMADMESIMEVAQKYKLVVIEDATEALGSYYTDGAYKSKFAGTIGDIGVFSFNGNKIITTGGGGMLVSDNTEFVKKAKHLSTQAKQDERSFVHDEIGYNYRLTNLQAAMGIAQLEQLEGFIETKQKNYMIYKEFFSKVPGMRILDFKEGTRSNCWFYALYIDGFKQEYKEGFMDALQEKGIQTRPIWGLIHQQVMYQQELAYKIERALDYFEHVINIPCSSNLTEDEVMYVAQCIKSYWGEKNGN